MSTTIGDLSNAVLENPFADADVDSDDDPTSSSDDHGAGQDGAIDRAKGCVLGLMLGDALGAGVEGWPPSEIEALAQSLFGTASIDGHFAAVPMGTFVSAGQPGQYRAATGVDDAHAFVPTGPPSNASVAAQCARRGMYTDDTNQSLALAAAIVEHRGVDPAAVGRSYARFFRHEPYRGYPPSSKRVMVAIEGGASVDDTGLPPHFPFAGGSYANGGGMKISPMAIPYRNAPAPAFRAAAAAAVRCSHRNPEAVDFAAVQAAAVRYALTRPDPAAFDPHELLDSLAAYCETGVMQAVLAALKAALKDAAGPPSPDFAATAATDFAAARAIVDAIQRPGSGMGFQIASVHMAPCVLWTVCRHHATPLRAVKQAIALGGDTDTTASMVGAIVGALHGTAWANDLAADLENEAYGRDYALNLAEQLVGLDLGV